MPTLHAYNYAYVRVVPRVERAEFFNAGVILFCRTKRFLAARIAFRTECLVVMAPDLDEETVQTHLNLIPRICAGEGPIGQLELAERFHWLVAPHDSVIQCGPTHTGLCQDPLTALERLVVSLQRE